MNGGQTAHLTPVEPSSMVRPTITAVGLTEEQVRLPGAEVMAVMRLLAAATVTATKRQVGVGEQCSWHCLSRHAESKSAGSGGSPPWSHRFPAA